MSGERGDDGSSSSSSGVYKNNKNNENFHIKNTQIKKMKNQSMNTFFLNQTFKIK